MGNSIIRIRGPRDSLFFIMGIPVLVRRYLYIKTAAWILEIQFADNRLKICLQMAEISESDTIFFLSTVNVTKLNWPPSGVVYLKHTIYEWTQLQYKLHAFLHKASLDPDWQGKGITVLQLAVSYGYIPCMIFKIFVVEYLFPIWAIILKKYIHVFLKTSRIQWYRELFPTRNSKKMELIKQAPTSLFITMFSSLVLLGLGLSTINSAYKGFKKCNKLYFHILDDTTDILASDHYHWTIIPNHSRWKKFKRNIICGCLANETKVKSASIEPVWRW